jgi:hypothetical protein
MVLVLGAPVGELSVVEGVIAFGLPVVEDAMVVELSVVERVTSGLQAVSGEPVQAKSAACYVICSGGNRMRGYRLLWHCGWCQPLRGWQRALYAAGIRWTTGICSRCLAQEKERIHRRRPASAG